jgi:hypothetical protein
VIETGAGTIALLPDTIATDAQRFQDLRLCQLTRLFDVSPRLRGRRQLSI